MGLRQSSEWRRKTTLAIESDLCIKWPRLAFYMTQKRCVIFGVFFPLCLFSWRGSWSWDIIVIIIMIVWHTCKSQFNNYGNGFSCSKIIGVCCLVKRHLWIVWNLIHSHHSQQWFLFSRLNAPDTTYSSLNSAAQNYFAAPKCSSVLNRPVSSASRLVPQLRTSLRTPSSWNCTPALLEQHLQNFMLTNHLVSVLSLHHKANSRAPVTRLSSSLPWVSKLPFNILSFASKLGYKLFYSFPCQDMAIHVFLTITEWLAGYFVFLGTVLPEGVLFLPLSIDLGKELSKQAYCPNVDTQPLITGKMPRGKRCSGTQVQISWFHLTLKSPGNVIKGQIKDKSHLHLLKEETRTQRTFRPSQRTIFALAVKDTMNYQTQFLSSSELSLYRHFSSCATVATGH